MYVYTVVVQYNESYVVHLIREIEKFFKSNEVFTYYNKINQLYSVYNIFGIWYI